VGSEGFRAREERSFAESASLGGVELRERLGIGDLTPELLSFLNTTLKKKSRHTVPPMMKKNLRRDFKTSEGLNMFEPYD
jgi:hypothetical protein